MLSLRFKLLFVFLIHPILLIDKEGSKSKGDRASALPQTELAEKRDAQFEQWAASKKGTVAVGMGCPRSARTGRRRAGPP
jgi:hypothetical protein